MNDILQNHLPEVIAIAIAMAGITGYSFFNKKFLAYKKLEIASGKETGSVTKIESLKGGTPLYRYEFNDHLNKKNSGSFTSGSRANFKIGDSIEVLYDQSNSAINYPGDFLDNKIKGFKFVKLACVIEMTIMPIIFYVLLKFFIKM